MEDQGPTDIVPFLPDHPIVQWCRNHIAHPVQILVSLSEDWNSKGPYHESFAVSAVFWTRSEATLFKLTWG